MSSAADTNEKFDRSYSVFTCEGPAMLGIPNTISSMTLPACPTPALCNTVIFLQFVAPVWFDVADVRIFFH